MLKDLTNRIGYIYKITAPDGKIYIGQTINLNDRKSRYKTLRFKNQIKLWRSSQAHTWNVLDAFEIIEECLCGENKIYLNGREIYWITFYDSFKNGLNCTAGGNGNLGRSPSEETRKKISEAGKGKIPWMQGKRHSEETKKKISEANTGNESWMKGKTHSEETKEKQRTASSGKKQSQETINKRIKSNTGRKNTDEVKIKMSESAKKGRNSHNYNSTPILQYKKNILIKEWPDLQALKEAGFNTAYISHNCNGHVKTSLGYKWKFKNETI